MLLPGAPRDAPLHLPLAGVAPSPQSYLVEPKNFNAVQELVAKESRGSGSVSVSSVAVVHDDEDGEL